LYYASGGKKPHIIWYEGENDYSFVKKRFLNPVWSSTFALYNTS